MQPKIGLFFRIWKHVFLLITLPELIEAWLCIWTVEVLYLSSSHTSLDYFSPYSPFLGGGCYDPHCIDIGTNSKCLTCTGSCSQKEWRKGLDWGLFKSRSLLFLTALPSKSGMLFWRMTKLLLGSYTKRTVYFSMYFVAFRVEPASSCLRYSAIVL